MADRERVICRSADLVDGGPGVRFRRDPGDPEENAFAVRQFGRVTAFVNRCPHQGTELDWEPGQFFDIAQLYLVCATHGALFEPATGLCIAGPCRGASLERLEVREEGGAVLLAPGNPPTRPR